MSLRTQMRYMNPYDIHKAIINEYVLKRPGDTKCLKRDSSKDKSDIDILKEKHKFVWDNQTPQTWEEQFAKKYYDKLFKEYSIGDLSRYKENKIALRWRTEHEVITGKGQFICAEKRCTKRDGLRSWEVNFAYQEDGQKKNALVKIRLCPSCSKKINFHSKKKEVKKKSKLLKEKEKSTLNKEEKQSYRDDGPTTSSRSESGEAADYAHDSAWESSSQQIPLKTREEEMEDYLHDLLL